MNELYLFAFAVFAVVPRTTTDPPDRRALRTRSAGLFAHAVVIFGFCVGAFFPL